MNTEIGIRCLQVVLNVLLEKTATNLANIFNENRNIECAAKPSLNQQSVLLAREHVRTGNLQKHIVELSGQEGLYCVVEAECSSYSPAAGPGTCGVTSAQRWKCNVRHLQSWIQHSTTGRSLCPVLAHFSTASDKGDVTSRWPFHILLTKTGHRQRYSLLTQKANWEDRLLSAFASAHHWHISVSLIATECFEEEWFSYSHGALTFRSACWVPWKTGHERTQFYTDSIYCD